MAKRKSTPSSVKRQAKRLSLAQKAYQKERRLFARQEEKEFRHSASKLKKLGLAFTKSTPKTKRRSSRAKGIIEQFRDVLEGRAKAHKIGKTGASNYAKAKLPGIRATNSHIIVPIEPGTSTYVRGGNLYRKRVSPEGKVIHRTRVLPVEIHSVSLAKFIDDLRENPKYERELKKGNYWSFRFFGHNSYGTYENMELLANYFEDYKSVQLALKEETEMQQEIIESVEIFQLPKDDHPRIGDNAFAGVKRKYSRSEYAKSLYRRDAIRNPEKHEAEKERKRQSALDRYRKIRDDPQERAKKRARDKARYQEFNK